MPDFFLSGLSFGLIWGKTNINWPRELVQKDDQSQALHRVVVPAVQLTSRKSIENKSSI